MTDAGSTVGSPGIEVLQQRDETAQELDAGLRSRAAYLQRHLRAVPTCRRARSATTVIIVALIGAFFVLDYLDWTSGSPGAAAIVVVVVLVSAAFHVRHQRYREAMAEVHRANALSGQRFTLDDEGLQWAETSGSRSTIPLSHITDIVDDAERVLIVLAPSRAILLTKTAYDSTALQIFLTELMRRWQAARTPA